MSFFYWEGQWPPWSLRPSGPSSPGITAFKYISSQKFGSLTNKLTSISIKFTDPSFVHTYAGESYTFSEKMVNSTFSTPGQPAMATHAEGSFSKCPRYL